MAKLWGYESGSISIGTYRQRAEHKHFEQLNSNVFILEEIHLKEE